MRFRGYVLGLVDSHMAKAISELEELNNVPWFKRLWWGAYFYNKQAYVLGKLQTLGVLAVDIAKEGGDV